jgi:hypothetical protein
MHKKRCKHDLSNKPCSKEMKEFVAKARIKIDQMRYCQKSDYVLDGIYDGHVCNKCGFKSLTQFHFNRHILSKKSSCTTEDFAKTPMKKTICGRIVTLNDVFELPKETYDDFETTKTWLKTYVNKEECYEQYVPFFHRMVLKGNIDEQILTGIGKWNNL